MPLCIVGGGFAAAGAFYATRPQAAPTREAPPVTHVEAVDVELVTHEPTVEAMGIVSAEKQVAIVPEVAGRITEQNAALVEGGRVAAGDPLVRIDARDYSLAVQSVQADLAQARLLVREEKTLRKVAEHEWRDRPEGFSEETLSFALRQPHIDAAQAKVRSAKSRIAKAKRDLGRTILRAPFDAVVLSESVDVGQTVAPPAPIATLAGIERFWVKVSLPVSQLPFIDIPDVNTADTRGSAAVVHNEAEGDNATRDGYVVRLHGPVDQRGRMAQLFVAVDDPLGRHTAVEQRPLPLLLGTSVRIEIRGRPLPGVAVLPRRAVRHDGTVWTLDSENRLQLREVTVLWSEPGKSVIESGLRDGDRVVITPLAIATEGMKVTIAAERPE